MQRDRLPQAEPYRKRNRRRRIWQKVVGGLACAVVFCTTYALILPAITMEKETICGLEEHTHTEACYDVEAAGSTVEFLCSPERLADHVHDRTCYDEDGALSCGYADFVIHTHDGLCYDENGNLICPLPEIKIHEHDADCYQERLCLTCGQEETGHVHDKSCYTRYRGELACGLAETEGHTHDADCYRTIRELACGLEENAEHAHDDSCYREQTELICSLPEVEGHTHTDNCYDWISELTCGLEEVEGHIHDESCYTAETVLTCRKQEAVPHTHDADCFDANGALNCGQVQVFEHAHNDECFAVTDPEDAEPVLICGKTEHQHSDACYEQEDDDLTDDLTDGSVDDLTGDLTGDLASDELPADDPGEAEPELVWADAQPAVIYEDGSYDNILYDPTVIAVTGMLPENAEIRAFPVSVDAEHPVLCAYDISVVLPDGSVYEPQDGEILTVTIQTPALDAESASESTAFEVFYVPEYGDPTPVASTVTDEGICFDAGHFSVYMVLAVDANTVTTLSALQNAISDGASYIQLGADFSSSSKLTIPSGADITLDLNGHTLTADGALFTIPSGASLTIVDSQAKTESVESVSGDLAGRTASLSDSTLTYYVTTTRITNSSTGATQESLEKHTVSATGAIAGGSQPVFNVSGGTLTIAGGMIRGGTGRAIVQTGGTTNLTGGYLCGFTQSPANNADTTAFGGAIQASSGTLELSGTVLAGNTAPNGGAIYATGSTQIPITGGIISGNTANRTTSNWDNHSESGAYRCGGGGIYADQNAEIAMSGGYITNNVATHTGYFDGGGGVCLSGTSTMSLSGGYVTGNQAQGGGGIRTDFGKGTTFVMTGGFVSSNVATHAEGGGIAIDRSGTGTITGGYITNNQIPNTGHWGGGGLFCADGSTLNLKNTLITENTAGGFGAGVAGCPTGNLYLYVTEGCAIYDNEDTVDGDSPHFTSDGVKQIDKEICTEVFQSNGHTDFFCALNSTVTGTMLGGDAANWQGSADYQPVIADAEDLLSATRVMGLEAHPTEAAKSAAQAAAKVYINGNYSYTHGGGIMCNGNLVIGVPVDIEVPSRIELQATKSLVDGSGNAQSLEDNDFSFLVTMAEPDGTVIANGVCDSSGKISFDHQLTFKQNGTFVYYIYEEADAGNPSIRYDPIQYRLTVTVQKDNGVAWYGDTIKYTYAVTSVKVESSTDGQSWTTVSQNNTSQSGIISLPLTSGAAFTNHLIEVTKLTVQKKWEGGTGTDSITVILKQDGVEFDRQTLNAGNNWTYTWDDLDRGHTYTVEEIAIPGYTTSYEITTSQDDSGSTSLGQGSWWVPATTLTAGQQYLIVSADGSKALCVASGGEGDGFNTADVASVTQQTTGLTVNGRTYSSWYQAADIPARSIYNAEALTRNSHSGIILKRSDGGSYPYLRLESNNNNYLKGGSTTTYASFLVFDGIYLRGHNTSEWTPDNLRTIIFESNKFNSTTEQNPANAAKLYTLVSGEGFTGTTTDSSTVVITNTRDSSEAYELPETGGPGTQWYTASGLALAAGALLVWILRRRKGAA